MTITAVHRFVEERSRPPVPADGKWPQPTVYPAPDFPFRGWQPPQPEGYVQSANTPDDSAIVIDTGMRSTLHMHDKRLIAFQAPAL